MNSSNNGHRPVVHRMIVQPTYRTGILELICFTPMAILAYAWGILPLSPTWVNDIVFSIAGFLTCLLTITALSVWGQRK
jgi:hypothetical protein